MSFSRAPTDRLPAARRTPGGNSTISFGTDEHSFPQRREQAGSRYVQQQQRREQTHYRRDEKPQQQQRRDLTPVGGRSTVILGTDRETTPRSTQRAVHQKIHKDEYTMTPRMTGHTAGGKSTIDLSTSEYPHQQQHRGDGTTTPVSSAHTAHRGFGAVQQETGTPLCLPHRAQSPGSPRFAAPAHNDGTPRNAGTGTGTNTPRNAGTGTGTPRNARMLPAAGSYYTSSYSMGDGSGNATPRGGAPTTPRREMVTTPRHMCPPGGNATICLGTDEHKFERTEKHKSSQFSMGELDVTSSTVCDQNDDGQKHCSPTVPPRRLDVAYNACMVTRGTPAGGHSSIRLG